MHKIAIWYHNSDDPDATRQMATSASCALPMESMHAIADNMAKVCAESLWGHHSANYNPIPNSEFGYELVRRINPHETLEVSISSC